MLIFHFSNINAERATECVWERVYNYCLCSSERKLVSLGWDNLREWSSAHEWCCIITHTRVCRQVLWFVFVIAAFITHDTMNDLLPTIISQSKERDNYNKKIEKGNAAENLWKSKKNKERKIINIINLEKNKNIKNI